MSKPPLTISLTWDHALEFTGEAGKHEVGMDGASYTAPSPMQLLALSLAGCMAIDIVHILGKMRAEPKSLRAEVEGERAATDPKRFTRLRLRFDIGGERITPVEVERAISLSREKYCSVLHSLQTDIEVDTSYIIHG